MPHTERKKSETGFYHVVVKGDGGQILFESDSDRVRFLEELESAAMEHKVLVHAYCLMDNHVHLLVEDRDDARGNLSPFMKQLCERYAMHFRKVTGRVGHVFQGRFWSEPIDSNEYYLTALRYIHANPEPAGICLAENYPWSSYSSFVKSSGFVQTDLALDLLGGVQVFVEFQRAGGNYARPFPSSKLTRHLKYDELLRIAKSVLGEETFGQLKTMKPQERGRYLSELSAAGFTPTQIVRLTGIGHSSVTRALR